MLCEWVRRRVCCSTMVCIDSSALFSLEFLSSAAQFGELGQTGNKGLISQQFRDDASIPTRIQKEEEGGPGENDHSAGPSSFFWPCML